MTRTPLAGDDGYDHEFFSGLQENLAEAKAHMGGIMEQLRERDLLAGETPQPQPLAPQAPALIVLRPGDKVLIALVNDSSDAEAKDLANTLRTSFPGVSFTVAGGIAGICVQS